MRLFTFNRTAIQRFHLKIVHGIIILGIVLIAVGASELSSTSKNDQSTGRTLRKVGSIIMALGFLAVCACAGLFWTSRKEMYPFHQNVSILAVFL